MTRQTSLAYQKLLLEQFSVQLADFAKEFQSLYRKYDQVVLSLYEEQGILEEIYVDYRNDYVNGIKEEVESIVSKINEEHLPFVDKEIDFVSSRQ